MSDEVLERLVQEVVALRRRVAHLETLENPVLPASIDADLLDGQHGAYYRDADTLDGQHGDFYEQPLLRALVCTGRLTLTSGVPVTTSGVAAATTLYFTPYRGARVALYNGSTWVLSTLTERSLALGALSANTNYDIFLYDNAGALTLEAVAWTNDTTRATALALQDGVYVKSGATERRYLGTIRTTGTAGQCEDSVARRFVWNCYNRVGRTLYAADSTAQWTYTSTAWRPSNNNTTDGVGRFALVLGLSEGVVRAEHMSIAGGSSGSGSIYPAAGIGLDATTTNHAQLWIGRGGDNYASPHVALYVGYPSAGYHYFQRLEKASNSNALFYGTQGPSQTGMFGYIEG